MSTFLKKVPPEYRTITTLLIAINVIFYVIISILSLSLFTMNPYMIFFFGLSYYTFTNLYLWQIVTHIFFHASIGHLLSNMIFLAVYGYKLEDMGFDKNDILKLYFILGILSSVLTLPILGSHTVTVGASGAIFGFLGVIVGYARKTDNPDWKRMLYSGIIFIVLSTGANTNVLSHIFGFILGLISGYYPQLYGGSK